MHVAHWNVSIHWWGTMTWFTFLRHCLEQLVDWLQFWNWSCHVWSSVWGKRENRSPSLLVSQQWKTSDHQLKRKCCCFCRRSDNQKQRSSSLFKIKTSYFNIQHISICATVNWSIRTSNPTNIDQSIHHSLRHITDHSSPIYFIDQSYEDCQCQRSYFRGVCTLERNLFTRSYLSMLENINQLWRISSCWLHSTSTMHQCFRRSDLDQTSERCKKSWVVGRCSMGWSVCLSSFEIILSSHQPNDFQQIDWV